MAKLTDEEATQLLADLQAGGTEQLTAVRERLVKELGDADAAAAEEVRVQMLGQKAGLLKKAFSGLKQVPAEKRKDVARALQQTTKELTAAIEARKSAAAAPAAKKPGVDLSLPGAFPTLGKPHVLNQTIEEISRIFAGLGFEVAEGPEVETEWHNFDALNIPPEHPAREDYQSFYLGHGRALRSQTSSVQVRVMARRVEMDGQQPVRVIAPGRVYRPDRIDATHHSTFHQVEGLWVDEGVTMADLKGVLYLFIQALLGEDTEIRFRPSFFPFTEPSAELDVHWSVSGKPEEAEWVEMGGCGMVDPNVLEAVGYDPERWTGFAFGLGIERLAMQRWRIDDIRLFMENDLRFLEQF